jgi:Helicase associated domain
VHYHRFQQNLSSVIDQKRIDLLNELGFTWKARDRKKPRELTSRVETQKDKTPSKQLSKWLTMLELLKKFKEVHGHCIVLRGFEDQKLANWVRSHVCPFQPCYVVTSILIPFLTCPMG